MEPNTDVSPFLVRNYVQQDMSIEAQDIITPKDSISFYGNT